MNLCSERNPTHFEPKTKFALSLAEPRFCYSRKGLLDVLYYGRKLPHPRRSVSQKLFRNVFGRFYLGKGFEHLLKRILDLLNEVAVPPSAKDVADEHCIQYCPSDRFSVLGHFLRQFSALVLLDFRPIKPE